MAKQKKPTLEEIEDKLDEARFFLGHVHDEKAKQAQPNKPSPKPFRYYLSALITAARSVIDLVEKSGRQDWPKQRSADEMALYRHVRQMRKESVHFGRIETIRRTEEVPIPLNPDPSQYHHPHLRAQALALRQHGVPWTEAEVHYIEFNGEKREVAAFFEDCVALLGRVVESLK